MTPFILRQWQESDAPALAKYLNNKKIWDNCRDSLPCPYTEKDATSFIQHTKSKEIQNNYCIEIRQASGKQVFSIKLASKMDTSWIAIVSSCCKNTHYNHSPLPTSKSAASSTSLALRAAASLTSLTSRSPRIHTAKKDSG